MCEQTGEEIDWQRCPPDIDDFPESVYIAVGYVGKDYTNLNLLYGHYYVEKHEEEWIFELLLYLDRNQIEDSQSRMKAEMDKIKKR